jgi:ABC-type sulfate/molybdate transport systems ATPase subunit
LLDEPLNALDTSAQTTIRKEIKTLIRQTGTPCIVVTHDIGDALELGDSASLLDRGRIVKCGRPEEVIATSGMTQPPSSTWQTSLEVLEKRGSLFSWSGRERKREDTEVRK